MSKEQEPVRSRRQLRAANSEQKQGAADYPQVPYVAAPSTSDKDSGDRRTGPADDPSGRADRPGGGTPAVAATHDTAVPAARERESQTRARDRAALRAYKELVDAAPAQLSPLPSRRALRRAQLDADRAPITSINPVVRPAKASSAKNLPPVPQAAPSSAVGPSGPAARPATPGPAAKPAAAASPASAPPTPAAEPPATSHRPRMGRRAAATAPDALPGAAAEGAARPSAAAAGSAAPLPVQGPVPGAPYPSVSAGPGVSGGQTPTTEELRLLAEQRAQSERAAVLDQRAQARERLAQESAKNRRSAPDPTSTTNLAMVTPMEFVDVPGVDRPVLRPPSTTHVPIVTRSTPKQAPGRRPAGGKPSSGKPASAKPASGRSTSGRTGHASPRSEKPGRGNPPTGQSAAPRDPNAERFDAALAARAVHRPGPGNRPLTGGRSSTLQRAEAMAAVVRPGAPVETGSVTRTQMPPMPADYAHGLEPLDAVTAGLGRTKRNLLIQWGSIILGGAALVVGAVMFITALAR
ncbi:hypothetical protein B5P43_13215 [Bacillus sp. SRB_336]|nr:hypothetical protein B5P43_13215 [Bacillus sp. SRB_336]